jgi:hypothetical protein
MCGVHHLAGIPHLADYLPTGVTDTTVACSGRSSLALFVPQRQRAPKLPNMIKRTRHSPFTISFDFSNGVSLLIPISCNYDDLSSLIRKTLLHHCISISEGNFHQLRRLTKCLWQIGNDGVYRPALKPAQHALCKHGGEGGYEQLSKQSFIVYLTAKKLV